MTDEKITPTEIARRVVALGYAPTMTRQRVLQLADDDPGWPVPREQWERLGAYWLIEWEPVRSYFEKRVPVSGPAGWRRPAADAADVVTA